MDELNQNKFRFSWRNYSNIFFINSKGEENSQTTNLIDEWVFMSIKYIYVICSLAYLMYVKVDLFICLIYSN